MTRIKHATKANRQKVKCCCTCPISSCTISIHPLKRPLINIHIHWKHCCYPLAQWFPNVFNSRPSFQNINFQDSHNFMLHFKVLGKKCSQKTGIPNVDFIPNYNYMTLQADSVTFVDTHLSWHSSKQLII